MSGHRQRLMGQECMTRQDGKGRKDKGREGKNFSYSQGYDGRTVKFKVAVRVESGACLDRAVVSWSGRSIGRAAGIGFGVVIWGSRFTVSEKWSEYRSEFRRSRNICPSRVDRRL
jgi:hypothetical protein